jgi:hypothetical protein
MAVWWCCKCGVETRRDSEMVCGDCKVKNTLVRNGFRATSGVELESPATAVTAPGDGRLLLKASRHD